MICRRGCHVSNTAPRATPRPIGDRLRSFPTPQSDVPQVALSDYFKSGQRLSRENRPTEVASKTEIVLSCRLLYSQVSFRAPVPWTALEHVSICADDAAAGRLFAFCNKC